MPNNSRTLITICATTLLVLAQQGFSAPAAGSKSKPGDSAASNVRLYRYKNKDGVQVTGTSIAPEYARKGYQVVTMGGVVLETIPPEPTPEERALHEQEQQNKLSAAQQQEKDRELMLRYSKTDEILLAKERKLTEIDNKIKMLNANVSTLKQQIEIQQEQAATYERNGQPIPPALITKIDGLQQELKVSESQVSTRKQEMTEETARFDAEIERFKFLEQKNPKRN